MVCFQISILAILILLNMIFGVIVSIFSEIREKANFKENDQNNKCFICNIDRAIFERLKIKFEDVLIFHEMFIFLIPPPAPPPKVGL